MKRIYIIIFTIIITHQLYGQDTTRTSKFGLRAGPNISTIYFKGKESRTGHRVGYSFGFFAQNSLSKNFLCEFGINFSSKGEKYGYLINDKNYNRITKLDYLELPIMFIYKKPISKLRIGAGPYLAYAISGKYIQEYPGMPVLKEKISFDREYKPLDIGLNLLVGFQFDKNLSINANYSSGFLNISNIRNSSVYTNKVYSIGLNLLF